MRLDPPQRLLPSFPIGENANVTALRRMCPRRDYRLCFGQAMARRYPSPELFQPRRDKDVSFGATQYAQMLFPGCTSSDARDSVVASANPSPPQHTPPPHDGGADGGERAGG